MPNSTMLAKPKGNSSEPMKGNLVRMPTVRARITAISLTSGTMDGAADNIGPPIWDAVAQKIIALNQINVENKYEALGGLGFFLAFLRGIVANWLVCPWS